MNVLPQMNYNQGLHIDLSSLLKSIHPTHNYDITHHELDLATTQSYKQEIHPSQLGNGITM